MYIVCLYFLSSSLSMSKFRVAFKEYQSAYNSAELLCPWPAHSVLTCWIYQPLALCFSLMLCLMWVSSLVNSHDIASLVYLKYLLKIELLQYPEEFDSSHTVGLLRPAVSHADKYCHLTQNDSQVILELGTLLILVSIHKEIFLFLKETFRSLNSAVLLEITCFLKDLLSSHSRCQRLNSCSYSPAFSFSLSPDSRCI